MESTHTNQSDTLGQAHTTDGTDSPALSAGASQAQPVSSQSAQLGGHQGHQTLVSASSAGPDGSPATPASTILSDKPAAQPSGTAAAAPSTSHSSVPSSGPILSARPNLAPSGSSSGELRSGTPLYELSRPVTSSFPSSSDLEHKYDDSEDETMDQRQSTTQLTNASIQGLQVSHTRQSADDTASRQADSLLQGSAPSTSTSFITSSDLARLVGQQEHQRQLFRRPAGSQYNHTFTPTTFGVSGLPAQAPPFHPRVPQATSCGLTSDLAGDRHRLGERSSQVPLRSSTPQLDQSHRIAESEQVHTQNPTQGRGTPFTSSSSEASGHLHHGANGDQPGSFQVHGRFQDQLYNASPGPDSEGATPAPYRALHSVFGQQLAQPVSLTPAAQQILDNVGRNLQAHPNGPLSVIYPTPQHQPQPATRNQHGGDRMEGQAPPPLRLPPPSSRQQAFQPLQSEDYAVPPPLADRAPSVPSTILGGDLTAAVRQLGYNQRPGADNLGNRLPPSGAVPYESRSYNPLTLLRQHNAFPSTPSIGPLRDDASSYDSRASPFNLNFGAPRDQHPASHRGPPPGFGFPPTYGQQGRVQQSQYPNPSRGEGGDSFSLGQRTDYTPAPPNGHTNRTSFTNPGAEPSQYSRFPQQQAYNGEGSQAPNGYSHATQSFHSPYVAQPPLRPPHIKLSLFDPATFSANHYVRLFSSFVSTQQITDPLTWAQLFLFQLEKQPIAQRRLSDLRVEQYSSSAEYFTAIINAFRREFSPTAAQVSQYRGRLTSIHKQVDENISDFNARYERCLNLAYPDEDMPSEEATRVYLQALESDVRRALAGHNVTAGHAYDLKLNIYPLLDSIYQLRSPTETRDLVMSVILSEKAKARAATTPFSLSFDPNDLNRPSGNTENAASALSSIKGNTDPFTTPPLKVETQKQFSQAVAQYERRFAPEPHEFAPSNPQRAPRNDRRPNTGAGRAQRGSGGNQGAPTKAASVGADTQHPGGNQRRPPSGDNNGGPCTECGMGHAFSHCPRNKKSPTYNEFAGKFFGKGLHPYAPGGSRDPKRSVNSISQPPADYIFADEYGYDEPESLEEGDEPGGGEYHTDEADTAMHDSTSHGVMMISQAPAARSLAPETNFMTIALVLNGLPVHSSLIDSGAWCTVMSKPLWVAIGSPNLTPLGPHQVSHSAGGAILPMLGVLRATISIAIDRSSYWVKQHPILVAHELAHQLILGQDFINQAVHTISPHHQVVTIRNLGRGQEPFIAPRPFQVTEEPDTMRASLEAYDAFLKKPPPSALIPPSQVSSFEMRKRFQQQLPSAIAPSGFPDCKSRVRRASILDASVPFDSHKAASDLASERQRVKRLDAEGRSHSVPPLTRNRRVSFSLPAHSSRPVSTLNSTRTTPPPTDTSSSPEDGPDSSTQPPSEPADSIKSILKPPVYLVYTSSACTIRPYSSAHVSITPAEEFSRLNPNATFDVVEQPIYNRYRTLLPLLAHRQRFTPAAGDHGVRVVGLLVSNLGPYPIHLRAGIVVGHAELSSLQHSAHELSSSTILKLLLHSLTPTFSRHSHRVLPSPPRIIASVEKPAAAPPDSPPNLLGFLDVNPKLPPSARSLLNEMLTRNSHAFASRELHGPTLAHDVVHHIRVPNQCSPVKQAPYRTSPATQAFISAQVQKLLEAGLIRPSNSPWASPVIVVPKSDGSKRMCVDYRQVNSRVVKDGYPLPRIEDCLHALRDSPFLSIIDLKDAFHHIPLHPDARPISAFVTKDGLFEWNVMTFGHTNAPGTFQRYINHVLRGLLNKKCIAYFDDIVVYAGKTLTEHAAAVEEVLQRLSTSGLTAKASKCHFGYDTIKFLGHQISKGTILPDPDKVTCITSMPAPTNVTGVKSFLGLANYYRRFIAQFSIIAKPLYLLTKKDVPFAWGKEQQQAFDRLKSDLVSAPCLYPPNFDLPFILQTDASLLGIGAVLTQIHEGVEHPIAFHSSQLTKAQQNYAAHELECLAVISAIKVFECYLLDKHFTIVTDSKSLQWLPSKNSENKRLARAAVFLSQFNYSIEHRRGVDNANADALSRLPARIDTSANARSADEYSSLHRQRVQTVNQIAYSSEYSLLSPLYLAVDSPHRHLFQPADKTHVRSHLIAPVTRPRKQPPAAASSPPTSAEGEVSPSNPSSTIHGDEIPDSYSDFTIENLEERALLISAQTTDVDLGPIRSYLTAKKVPSNWTLKQVQQLIHQSIHFLIHPSDDGLYYTKDATFSRLDRSPTGQLRLAIPQAYRTALIEVFHDSPYGGHLGVNRTYRKLALNYWWPQLAADVAEHVRSCEHCIKEKTARRTSKEIFAKAPIPTGVFQSLAMDFTGPFPMCEDFKYLLVITDLFSHWCIAIPTMNATAQTAARILLAEVYARFGAPLSILTDNGPHFVNALFAHLFRAFQCSGHTTAPYHPQANGAVERLNGTIKSILRTLCASYTQQWAQMISAATFAYNTSPHELTGLSPFFIVYGRHPHLPLATLTSEFLESAGNDPLIEQCQALVHTTRTAEAFVRNIYAAEAKKQIERSLGQGNTVDYKEGDQVVVAEPPHTGKTTKRQFRSAYTGPYTIIRRIGPASFEVRPTHRKRATPSIVHAHRLRPDRRTVIVLPSSRTTPAASADLFSLVPLPAQIQRQLLKPDFGPAEPESDSPDLAPMDTTGDQPLTPEAPLPPPTAPATSPHTLKRVRQEPTEAAGPQQPSESLAQETREETERDEFPSSAVPHYKKRKVVIGSSSGGKETPLEAVTRPSPPAAATFPPSSANNTTTHSSSTLPSPNLSPPIPVAKPAAAPPVAAASSSPAPAFPSRPSRTSQRGHRPNYSEAGQQQEALLSHIKNFSLPPRR